MRQPHGHQTTRAPTEGPTHGTGDRRAGGSKDVTRRHPDPKIRATRASAALAFLDSPFRTSAERVVASKTILANTDAGDPRRVMAKDILASLRPRLPFDSIDPAQQAGILCNDPRFQAFAATRSGFPGITFSATAAAEYLRQCCQIASRNELTTNTAALTLFEMLRTEFDAWTGKISTHR